MSFGDFELLAGGGPGLQFPFPFFDVFTIPTDAGDNEPRIVLDGTTGAILIYDNNGDLYASITPADGFQVFDPSDSDNSIQVDIFGGQPTIVFNSSDADEDIPGQINRVISGAGGGRNLTLVLNTGSFTGQSRARLVLISESQDGTEVPRVFIEAERLSVDPDMVEAATGPVGTIVGKIRVLSGQTSTTVLGFIPLYDAIT